MRGDTRAGALRWVRFGLCPRNTTWAAGRAAAACQIPTVGFMAEKEQTGEKSVPGLVSCHLREARSPVHLYAGDEEGNSSPA